MGSGLMSDPRIDEDAVRASEARSAKVACVSSARTWLSKRQSTNRL